MLFLEIRNENIVIVSLNCYALPYDYIKLRNEVVWLNN